MKKVNSSEKTAVYHTLYLLNLSFARIVGHCGTLHGNGFSKPNSTGCTKPTRKSYRPKLMTKCWKPFPVSKLPICSVSARSETLGTRNYATLTTFSSTLKNAERNSPNNNARNADSLS